VDNFAVNQTLTGDLAAVDSGQIFRLNFDTAPGDINKDTIVDLANAVLPLQLLSPKGIVPAWARKSDVSGDLKIGTQETLFVLQNVSALR